MSGATVVRTGSDHCMLPCDHEELDTIIVVNLQDFPEMYHMPGVHW